MSELNEIISQVQLTDLELEDARIKAERDSRASLRVQARSNTNSIQYSVSELIRQLGDNDQQAPVQDVDTGFKVQANEVVNEPKPKLDNPFPAPPTGPAPK